MTSLIISTKILFPNKVTFKICQGVRLGHTFGGTWLNSLHLPSRLHPSHPPLFLPPLRAPCSPSLHGTKGVGHWDWGAWLRAVASTCRSPVSNSSGSDRQAQELPSEQAGEMQKHTEPKSCTSLRITVLWSLYQTSSQSLPPGPQPNLALGTFLPGLGAPGG